ncbi:stage III sporulation protein AG [Tepidibacter formicigenes]|jgi:stage III sporulation protein AG|uniref:Stage III sporulation protein AG n=1 Tax=Tepidibacter formicigenes DSM 15518 TaxID=1123349 RepID=A0A1M6L315_9FIRM|nr:stage III sporulation protein AG [Tepidibacter formicigenes]SHJ65587.1 stage III sporulation protein AG [Tepidibacter formicigenes DSM 15518]
MENMKFDKKKMYSIIAVIIISLILLISISDIFDGKAEKNYPNATLVERKENIKSNTTKEEVLEERLEEILSNIQGVKSVKVMITLETNGEIEPAFNKVISTETTQENDSAGGRRVVTTENNTQTIVTTNNKQGNEPILLKSIEPQIRGVIVVAEGAENIVVKERLFNAVKTVLQVSGHKIEVYPKKK